MKCYYHTIDDAVATCRDCNKSLCSPCASKYTSFICHLCCIQEIKRRKKTIYKEIAITLAVGLIFLFYSYVLLHDQVPFTKLLGGFLFAAGIPAGWQLISRFTPQFRYTIIFTLFALFFYWWIKFVIALFIGYIVLPFKIFTTIKEWRAIKILQRVAATT